MTTLTHLEARAQRVFLYNQIVRYQQQNPAWQQQATIQRLIIHQALQQWPVGFIAILTFVLAGLVIILGQTPTYNLIFVVITLGGGLISLMVYLYSCLINRSLQQRALAKQLKQKQSQFSLKQIRDKRLQGKLLKALIAWTRIDEVIKGMPNALQSRFEPTRYDATTWLWTVFMLVQRMDNQRFNLLQTGQGLKQLPQTIQHYQQKLMTITDVTTRQHLEAILAQHQTQWDTLQQLTNYMEQVDYQLESTLSALATIHSQLLLVHHKKTDHVKSVNHWQPTSFRKLHDNITAQISQLQDLTEAIDEVYTHS